MQKPMEIKITIILNEEEYVIYVKDISKCSEVEAITSAMFQLSGFYEHFFCVDKDSVKWKLQFEDIYKLSSEDISTTEIGDNLDYMDIIIHAVYAIIRSVYSTDDINNDPKEFNFGSDITNNYLSYEEKLYNFMEQIFPGSHRVETCESQVYGSATQDDLLNKKLFSDLNSKASDIKLYDKIVKTLYDYLRKTIKSIERSNK